MNEFVEVKFVGVFEDKIETLKKLLLNVCTVEFVKTNAVAEVNTRKHLIVIDSLFDFAGLSFNGLKIGVSNTTDREDIINSMKNFHDVVDCEVSTEEVYQRIKNVISIAKHFHTYSVGNLDVDMRRSVVLINALPQCLTLTEFKIVFRLAEIYPSQISKNNLLKKVWESEFTSIQTFNSHLSNLRAKLVNWDYQIIYLKKENTLILERKN